MDGQAFSEASTGKNSLNGRVCWEQEGPEQEEQLVALSQHSCASVGQLLLQAVPSGCHSVFLSYLSPAGDAIIHVSFCGVPP
ncbi:hypothetical protein P7K49_002284, partial [Saguinus oedipus]